MYLVDTNVLSAGAPTRAMASPGLLAWMDGHSLDLYLSVITVAEIVDGIEKSRRLGAGRKADRLAEWLQTVLHLYGNRVLPVDLEAARHTGLLSDVARAQGQAPGLADLAIAGTARSRGYAILTRNLRHFERLGVPVMDPYEGLPPEAR
ncbi:type II toxin-antitoxin system VapC family toxin [Lichenicoccus roseus]|uniref:Ribonuclease VapC n=1 Tax=Lichenicoccus roseus TaxID=2683649 RepID=A0A5R9JE62_9PROT|nr:type II toxin-antitoxin system VapC family toxin [Lichenicoccus roseus]TLU72588.1 type II toxin-antitoxin system VapC family toxin [Lichenicoccus roseus]